MQHVQSSKHSMHAGNGSIVIAALLPLTVDWPGNITLHLLNSTVRNSTTEDGYGGAVYLMSATAQVGSTPVPCAWWLVGAALMSPCLGLHNALAYAAAVHQTCSWLHQVSQRHFRQFRCCWA
jgi:hypothetical protein